MSCPGTAQEACEGVWETVTHSTTDSRSHLGGFHDFMGEPFHAVPWPHPQEQPRGEATRDSSGLMSPVSWRKQGACYATSFLEFVKGSPSGGGGGCPPPLHPPTAATSRSIYTWRGPRETQGLRSHYREAGGGQREPAGCEARDNDGRGDT